MPRPLVPLLIAVLGMFTAQQLLAPALGPLSAQLELSATQLGLVFTITSVAVTLAGPLWDWAFDRLGLRPVLLGGAGLCLAGLAGFAAASVLVDDEALSPGLTFVLAVGFGFAVTGFFASASLNTAAGRQGTVAGAACATSGLAGLVVPPLGSVLHSVNPVVPVVAAGVAALFAAALAFVPRPVPQSAV